jgi:hypothetical protein
MTESEVIQLGKRWCDNMRRGDFERAWTISDTLLRYRRGQPCDHLPPECRWVWNGEPVAGRRVVVRAFRGLGDTLQFIRYAAVLRDVGAETIVCAPPRLTPLIATVDGVDRVIEERLAMDPGVVHDVQVEVMELPFVFRTELHNVPSHVPYIHVDRAPLPHSDGLNVGLVWQASEWDPRRSIPFALVRRLQKVPGVRWYVMQRGPGLAQWDGAFGRLPPAETLVQEARVMMSLDLLITIDSMPAHLAGALGVPTWLLLHAEADWRWLEAREDSPWYPRTRLFRQQFQGEWDHVLTHVQEALHALAAAETR